MSALEDKLLLQLRFAGLVEGMFREYRFDKNRRWRADFAWPKWRIILEVDGGSWAKGKHTRGTGFEKDCEKQNTAIARGWWYLRVTGKMINDGAAVGFVRSLQERLTKES